MKPHGGGGFAATPGASRLISAATGGTVEIFNDISIDIPPGALSRDTVVSIIPTDEPVESTTGVNRSMSLNTYTFLPENVPLIADATVTMHYDPTIIAALNIASGNNVLSEELLDIQYFDSTLGHYVSAGRTIDKVNHTIQANTQHFSPWEDAINIVSLAYPDDADWETKANAILLAGQDWNTTSLPEGYSYNNIYYPNLLNPTPPPDDPNNPTDKNPLALFGDKRRYNADVQLRWDDYVGIFDPTKGSPYDAPNKPGYYPPNSTDPGTPMDPVLFVISQMDNVPGYITAAASGLFYVDITFGSYIFFHAAQKHDRCDEEGYGTYHKDYSVCNAEFYADMKVLCDKFNSSGSATIWDRCMDTRETFKETVDTHLRLRVAGLLTDSNGKKVGIIRNMVACDDYEGAYARPVPTNRYKYCPGGPYAALNTTALASDLTGMTYPENVTLDDPASGNLAISKECGTTAGYPPLSLPRIVLKWKNPASTNSLQKTLIYRLDAIPPGTDPFFAWSDSLWKVIDTIVFGQYFYVEAGLSTYHEADYSLTMWDDQFDIKQATYEYYIKTKKTYTRNGQYYEFYSESPLRITGKYEPVTLSYKSAEFANVCLAKTAGLYLPDWRIFRFEY